MIITFLFVVVLSCILSYFITPRFKNDLEGRAKFLENL